jgi:hypothetical protein
MWRPAATAPFDRHIALSVPQHGEVVLLVFPCRRVADGWVNAETGKRLAVLPTHCAIAFETDTNAIVPD